MTISFVITSLNCAKSETFAQQLHFAELGYYVFIFFSYALQRTATTARHYVCMDCKSALALSKKKHIRATGQNRATVFSRKTYL